MLAMAMQFPDLLQVAVQACRECSRKRQCLLAMQKFREYIATIYARSAPTLRGWLCKCTRSGY